MAEIVTATELAEKIGVAYATVLAWRRRGWITGRRAIGPGGGRLVFDVAEVREEWTRNGERVLFPAGEGGKAVRHA